MPDDIELLIQAAYRLADDFGDNAAAEVNALVAGEPEPTSLFADLSAWADARGRVWDGELGGFRFRHMGELDDDRDKVVLFGRLLNQHKRDTEYVAKTPGWADYAGIERAERRLAGAESLINRALPAIQRIAAREMRQDALRQNLRRGTEDDAPRWLYESMYKELDYLLGALQDSHARAIAQNTDAAETGQGNIELAGNTDVDDQVAGNSYMGDLLLELETLSPDAAGVHPIANNRSIDASIDVVFLHGLGGKSHSSWRHGSEGHADHFFWPDDLGTQLPNCAVWSVGYPAGVTKFGNPGMIIEERGGNIAQKLANVGLGRRPLVFITHSMGGLIMKSLLVTSQTLPDQNRKWLEAAVAGIVFCAVPHRGSAFATAAGVLGGFKQEQVSEMTRDAVPLDSLHDKFVDWQKSRNVPILSFAEKRSMTQRSRLSRAVTLPLVVTRSSANPNIAGHSVNAVDEDHGSLVRPRRRTDDVPLGVERFLRRILGELTVVAPARTDCHLDIEIGQTALDATQIRVHIRNDGERPITIDHVGLSIPDTEMCIVERETEQQLRNGEGPEDPLQFRLDVGDYRLFAWSLEDAEPAIRRRGPMSEVRAEAKVQGELQRTDWVSLT